MEAPLNGGRTVLPLCANCGVEIPWSPALHRGRTFCCGGCAQGGPCYCSYDLAGQSQLLGWERDAGGTRVPAMPSRREQPIIRAEQLRGERRVGGGQ